MPSKSQNDHIQPHDSKLPKGKLGALNTRVRGRPPRPVVIEGLKDYRMVPVERIDVEGVNVRELEDSDHVIELAASIAKNGLLHPIVVAVRADRYQLIAGKHRLAAYRRMRWPEIPSHVVLPEDDTPLQALSLVENVVRKDLTLTEECAAVAYMTEVENLSPSQICDLTGKSRQWVDRRLMAPSLPDDVREALFEGTITLRHAEILGNIEDSAIRGDLLWRTVSQRWAAKVLEQVVEAYLAAPSIEAAVQAGVETAKEIQAAGPRQVVCGACKSPRHYTEVIYIPVCRDGCVHDPEPPSEQLVSGPREETE